VDLAATLRRRRQTKPRSTVTSYEGPDGPEYAYFHSLRHSYVALLALAGCTLKQAMALARHSDPKLTMARYGKAPRIELGAAVDRHIRGEPRV
jgi:integrase